ncbi:hypothetical protein ACLOJK_027975 [Asimina triloba]
MSYQIKMANVGAGGAMVLAMLLVLSVSKLELVAGGDPYYDCVATCSAISDECKKLHSSTECATAWFKCVLACDPWQPHT